MADKTINLPEIGSVLSSIGDKIPLPPWNYTSLTLDTAQRLDYRLLVTFGIHPYVVNNINCYSPIAFTESGAIWCTMWNGNNGSVVKPINWTEVLIPDFLLK